MKRTALAVAIISLGVATAPMTALAGSEQMQSKEDQSLIELSPRAKAGIIEGKVEGALLLNEHLNNFKIDIDVDHDEVTLSGDVDSAAEKALAEQVALSIDGVESVDNKLNVRKKDTEQKAADATSAVKDAAITAKVKASLLTNGNVSGTDINVDTEQSVVTLRGEVDSSIESELAEKITANIDDVKSVENELKVVSR